MNAPCPNFESGKSKLFFLIIPFAQTPIANQLPSSNLSILNPILKTSTLD
jgi:hypothetical protein